MPIGTFVDDNDFEMDSTLPGERVLNHRGDCDTHKLFSLIDRNPNPCLGAVARCPFNNNDAVVPPYVLGR